MISVLVDRCDITGQRLCGIYYCAELKTGSITAPSVSKLFSLHFLPHYFIYPILQKLQRKHARISYDLYFCVHEVQSRREREGILPQLKGEGEENSNSWDYFDFEYMCIYTSIYHRSLLSDLHLTGFPSPLGNILTEPKPRTLNCCSQQAGTQGHSHQVSQ